MSDPVEQATKEMEAITITPKTILCGCITIPKTTRKKFIFKGKPNPITFYSFEFYTLKQLIYIEKQLKCDLHYNSLLERLGSNNRMAQFLSDFNYYLNMLKNVE